MTATHNAGPLYTFGASGAPIGRNPDAGPSGFFQGIGFPDVRNTYHPGATGPGHFRSLFMDAVARIVDCVPTAPSATLISSTALGAVVPAGGSLPIVLQSTDSGTARAVNVPIVPFGRQQTVQNRVSALSIEPAHTKCTTSNGSATVTIPAGSDARLVALSQFVCIPGGAGAGVPLVARVIRKALNSAGAGTITLDTPASAVVTAGPLMLMDFNGAGVVPWAVLGSSAMWDPHGSVARVLSYTSGNASDTGYSVTTVGYDAALNPVSETVALTANATVNGRKAFKYVVSQTLLKTGGGTTAGAITVGVADIFGFPTKVESFNDLVLRYNGTLLTASTGFTAADGTTADVTTTGDVRGLYAVQSATDGSKRLVVTHQIPLRQMVATHADATPLFGVAQA